LKVCKTIAKKVLVKSKLTDYCINPYTNCSHACTYCYVPKMPWNRGKKWGEEVLVKTNAAEVLEKELLKSKRGTVLLSSATDAWQPIEENYGITRACLEVLANTDWPISALTKSPLVCRDIDVFKKFSNATIGLTISTDDDSIAKTFEPHAPPISTRIKALGTLHDAGLRTYAFVGPFLHSNPEKLAAALEGKVDFIFLDCLHYAPRGKGATPEAARELTKLLAEKGTPALNLGFNI